MTIWSCHSRLYVSLFGSDDPNDFITFFFYFDAVKCEEFEAALESFNKALDLAEDQDDIAAQNAIRKALEEVLHVFINIFTIDNI